jgi:hypothetical protein
MKLIVSEIIPREICHYASPNTLITSHYSKVFVVAGECEYALRLPHDVWWKRPLSLSRLARRALRLDKCNVVPVSEGLVILRQGKVYHYNDSTGVLSLTLDLRQCRNVLHQSIATIDGNDLFFGEYGGNPARHEVPVYRSQDGGKSWKIVFLFPKGKIRHIHGCYFDPYEEKVWVLTGDFRGECHFLCADKDFQNPEWIGDGQQHYRACNAFFEKDAIHWIMDSPLESSHHIKMDRKSRNIEIMQSFPGPVWYIKRLDDGYYLAATSIEDGVGVKDQYAHLMVSRDLVSWEDVYQFKHDGLPKRYFKFGVLGFPDGPQTSHEFYLFMESIEGLDGKIARCRLE